MLCKNCGKELPIAGKFCPYCGATVEQEGVNDETAVFTTLPDELNGPIDLSAFDAAMKDAHPASGDGTAAQDGVTTGDPLAATDPHIPAPGDLPPVETPPVRRTAGTNAAPRTTYFGTPDPDDRPYRKPSKGKKAAVIVVVVLIIAALIGGGVWFFLSRQPDESLTLAEQYMARGDFDKALEYYTAARDEASDPTSIDATIQLLRDYQAAQDYVDNGQYTEAVAALKQLQNRVTAPNSALYTAVADLLTQAQTGQADTEFSSDLSRAQEYLSNSQYDQCAAMLDTLDADDTLTEDQRSQVDSLREQLTQAQESAQRQEETQQQQSEQKATFSSRIDQLEQNDLQIASASTAEDELAMTASSFEQWDMLLSEMYDYLSTVLNADQYEAEQASFQQWVKERDDGAANAASEASDDTAAQLASYSFRQSYTKARCYKLLDMM